MSKIWSAKLLQSICFVVLVSCGERQGPPGLAQPRIEEDEGFHPEDQDTIILDDEPISQPSRWAHLDPKKYIKRQLLMTALNYFEQSQKSFSNKNYITIIDFSKYSGQRRFFVVDLKTGAVEALHTAHGAGSDPNHTGYAKRFSNRENSHMSSIGFYRTGSIYSGENGASLYLHGLSSTNSQARERLIVIHGASYVGSHLKKMGRSWGCPALSKKDNSRIINKIQGGSLIYAWGG